MDLRLRPGPEVLDGDVRCQFDQAQALGGDVQNAQVGDDPVDDALAGEGQGTLVDDLEAAVPGTCSIRTTTLLAPCTRSIAPPIPLTIFPGIIQFAMSPRADTCMAPRIAASILPPRIMPKLVAESKNEAPGER